MQTVHVLSELGGAIVALQAYWPCHLGIDNLNVALKFMGVVFLVLILLPGFTVLAIFANLLLSFEPCTGQFVLRIWVMLEVLFWNWALGWTSVAQ